jgi:hypothetical protein
MVQLYNCRVTRPDFAQESGFEPCATYSLLHIRLEVNRLSLSGVFQFWGDLIFAPRFIEVIRNSQGAIQVRATRLFRKKAYENLSSL